MKTASYIDKEMCRLHKDGQSSEIRLAHAKIEKATQKLDAFKAEQLSEIKELEIRRDGWGRKRNPGPG
jgi:hypothetical protein